MYVCYNRIHIGLYVCVLLNLFDIELHLPLIFPTVIMIGYNKSRDIFWPIAVVGCKNKERSNCTFFKPVMYILANSRLRRDFPRPPGPWLNLWAPPAPPLGRLRRPSGQPPPSAAVKEIKKKKIWGDGGAPVGASA